MQFARQPIVSAAGALAGYELLAMERPAHAGALAALTAVDLATAGGGADVFLDVTPSALATLDPLPFEPGGVVLELSARDALDSAILDRLAALAGRGYRLAVDDFHPDAPGAGLLAHATFAKIGAGAAAAITGHPLVRDALAQGTTLVATDVATREERDALADAGFALFQGAFHCRPSALPDPPAIADISRLRSATRIAAGGDADSLIAAIGEDPALSLRLLRFVNSAAIALRHEVSSIPHAVRLLGPRTVRQWALLVLVSGGDDREVSVPQLITALARARTCEHIARRLDMPEPDAYFLVGLLSVADALLDATMDQILADVPVTDDVRAALLQRSGGKGRALRMAEACEAGAFAEAALPGLDAGALLALHAEALTWADATALGVAPPVRAAAA